MAGIDPWKLCQGEIRHVFPRRTAPGTGERRRGEEEEKVQEEDSVEVDGGREGSRANFDPHKL